MAQATITQTKDMLNSFHTNALLTRPEGRRLTQLENEMANILARTDLSDRQKMEQFSHTLQNFQKVRGVIIDNGLMLTSTNSTVIPPEEQANQAEGIFSRIQDIIQEALKSEKPEEQQSIVSTPKTPISLKIKNLKKKLQKPKPTSKASAIKQRTTRASTAAAAAMNIANQQYDATAIKRLKSSGLEYTPSSVPRAKTPKNILKRSALRLITGNGHVNFDAW
jgi:hypothetical protein